MGSVLAASKAPLTGERLIYTLGSGLQVAMESLTELPNTDTVDTWQRRHDVWPPREGKRAIYVIRRTQ